MPYVENLTSPMGLRDAAASSHLAESAQISQSR